MAAADPFYMGTDVSLLPTIEQLSGHSQGGAGGPFKDDGVTRPAEQILTNHGNNLFRIRIFVNPQTTYTNTNYGAIQDQTYAIALAQRLKATGAKILLDFHYSDTWADPGQQAKPAAWSSLSFTQLQTRIHDYTRDTLDAFEAAGVMPEMVQVGNEITNGMLFSSGRLNYSGTTAQQQTSWRNLGSLLNSAIVGVRDAQGAGPHIQVALHVDQGDWDGHPRYYFGGGGDISRFTHASWGNVSDFDIIALSYYASTREYRSFQALQSNLNEVADANPGRKILLAEANYPWDTHTGLGVPDWPSTKAGQQQFLTDLRDAVMNVNNGAGMGVVWWYPEAIQVPGYNIYNGGDTALFDSNGNALPAINAFSTTSPTWNTDADGNWYNAMNWTGGVPMFAGDVANFGSAITAARTISLNGARSVATMNFSSAHSYTIGGSTLTLDAATGSAAINVTSGSHVISAPIVLQDDLILTVGPAAALTATGQLSAAGRSITKGGTGSAQFENVRAAALILNGGTLRISAKSQANDPAGTSIVNSLSVGAAVLDLTNNSMVIDYSGSPGTLENDVRTMLLSGQITSSAASGGMKLGYADNAAVDADSLLIEFTFAGDTNLDGQVTISDLGDLASNWQSTAAVWRSGDFNYDGQVTIADLGDLASNWQAGVGSPLGMSFSEAMAAVGLGGAAVPEPALPGLVIVGTCALKRRCRTSCRKVE